MFTEPKCGGKLSENTSSFHRTPWEVYFSCMFVCFRDKERELLWARELSVGSLQ